MAKSSKASKNRKQRVKAGQPGRQARKPARRAAAPPARRSAEADAVAAVPAKTPAAVQETLKPISQTKSWSLFVPSLKLWQRNGTASLIIYTFPAVLLIAGGTLAVASVTYELRYYIGMAFVLGGLTLAIVNLPVAIYLQLRAVRGELPGVLECYRNGAPQVFRFIGAGLLLIPLVAAGLALLIIPGVMLLRRYLLTPYYIIDGRLSIRDAMDRSAIDSKPVAPHILGTCGLFLLYAAACIYLFGPLVAPYGILLAALAASLFAYAPALRYKETALRTPAQDGLTVSDKK